jgi:hypothetical protein
MKHKLPENARKALLRARDEKLSYDVRVIRAPDDRLVAILGEAHMKLAKAAEIGKDVVSSFELRGVETFQKKQVLLGRALGVVIQAPRSLLRLLSLGAVKGSTITEAKQLPSGYTVELERAKKMPFALHVASVYMTAFFTVSFLAVLLPVITPIAPPFAAAITFLVLAFQMHLLMLVPAYLLRRKSWSFLIHPFMGILTPRDHLMVAGTLRMLEDHPKLTSSVVVMGRAHVSGYERLLVDRHGFTRVDDAL